MLELLHEPDAQKRAFVEACSWAESIHLCLSWIEPGDAQGPGYADLRPHEGKVRQAIVGLAHLKSYPALLRRLHRLSVLRLVSTVDGSFSPNGYLFRRGPRVRVILASAPFSSTRLGRSCESFVVFEGDRDDPFSLRALELLERCRSSAHVPTSSELDAYEEAWAGVRAGGRLVEAIPGLPLDTYDGSSLGALTIETSRDAILEAFVAVRGSLARAAAVRAPARVLPCWQGPGREELETTVFWSSLGMWSAIHRDEDRYGLHFGFVPPWEVERAVATLSLRGSRAAVPLADLAASALQDVMSVARSEDGRSLLVALGAEPGDHGGEVEIRDGSTSARGSLIGEIGAPDFTQTAAAFARRTSRRRAARQQENAT